ncbi:hypothetical protein [Streptomyces sp. RKAG337]|uniref:hypothetical protein n=1 Tax=Streptomyces sp. RKAG337 TaxID=2893404 RepID=UPI0020346D2F|nr:hypothetical protein [Streptomyces sp. RKAG337]MCM2425042.1 hypothetical protein [Streptomyces sp. RKAG337]
MPDTTYPAAGTPTEGSPADGAPAAGFTPQAARQETAQGFSRLVESLATRGSRISAARVGTYR